MTKSIISCKNLSKSYGKTPALSHFTTDIPAGAVGLLGPNGAGKTTLFKILMGVLIPDEGEVEIFDRDLVTSHPEYLRQVGYMPQRSCTIPGHTGLSYVTYLGELSGMSRREALGRAHEVLYFVGVGEERYRSLATLSFGQRQRINLAQALVHDPNLLLLDEPTTGLDADIRGEVLDLIHQIATEFEKPVFLSSQILKDVEAICPSIVLIDQKALYTGPIKDLLQGESTLYEVKITGELEDFIAWVKEKGGEVHLRDRGKLHLALPGEETPNFILEGARATDTLVRHLTPVYKSLEDIFVDRFGPTPTTTSGDS